MARIESGVNGDCIACESEVSGERGRVEIVLYIWAGKIERWDV